LDKQRNRLGTKVIAGVIAGALALSVASNARAQAAPVKPPQAAPAKAPTPPAKPGGEAASAAKPDLAAAKRHYGEGDKKYKAGDFAGALTEFKAANEIKSTPQAERYIGMTEDNLGHYAAAAEWYDKFLAHVPDKLVSEGEEIKKRDAEIKALPGKVHVETTPPGANVTVDGKPQSSPAPTDIELPPGPHAIKLNAPGRLEVARLVDVAFASTQTVSVTLEEAPPPPPPPPAPVAVAPPPPAAPPPPPPEPRSKVPAYITGGLAVAAAGVGTVFGIIALNDKSDFNKTPTTQIADNGDTHSLVSDMAFGVAITFGVTSAVLFLTKDEAPAAGSTSKDMTPKAVSSKRRAMTITPVPMVGSHSGGAGFSLQF